jgi:fructuronate reductase
MDPGEFIDTVLNVRFPNVFMPDSPQRIATDTSQKLAIRFGETIKAYLRSDNLSVKDLKIIPLVFAGWCRYLMGTDDGGMPFTPSGDPLLADISVNLKNIRLGDTGSFHKQLYPIFSNASIFGVDLYEAGLGKTAEAYFSELVPGAGAVRRTLKKYVSE